MWDKRFKGEDYLFGTEPAAALRALQSHLHEKGRTLVVADGEGRNSVFLAQQGYDVVATDSSSVGLDKARKLAAIHDVHVDYRLEDIYDADHSTENYDNVVAIFIQFAPPHLRSQIFKNLTAALRPGGILLLHGYTPEQVALGTGGPSDPSHMYTSDLLLRSFHEYEIIFTSTYRATLREGRGHSGPSALIDFVARKPL